MTIRLVVYMETFEGQRENAKASSAQRAPIVREQPGCEEFAMYQSIERPDRFVLLEKWRDQKALEDHWLTIQRPANTPPTRRIVEMERWEYSSS